VSDRAADGTGKSETRVESESRELLWHGGLSLLLDGVHLHRSGGRGWDVRSTRHFERLRDELSEWRWVV